LAECMRSVTGGRLEQALMKRALVAKIPQSSRRFI